MGLAYFICKAEKYLIDYKHIARNSLTDFGRYNFHANGKLNNQTLELVNRPRYVQFYSYRIKHN